MQHKIVVKQHRPWVRWTLIGGTAFVLVVGAVLIFGFTRKITISNYAQAQSELQTLRAERRRLARDLRTAHADLRKLQEEVAYLKHSDDIEAAANESVRKSLSEMQAQAAELREQVAFYRGIVSPQESRSGVRVLEAHVKPVDSDGRWRLELVLIQSMRQNRGVSGSMDIEVIGSEGGSARTLPLDQLLLDKTLLEGYSFKYFQEFGADFRLPSGFRPLQVAVTLRPKTKDMPPIESHFEWERIRAEDPS